MYDRLGEDMAAITVSSPVDPDTYLEVPWTGYVIDPRHDIVTGGGESLPDRVLDDMNVRLSLERLQAAVENLDNSARPVNLWPWATGALVLVLLLRR